MQCTHLGGMERCSLSLMQGLQRNGHTLEVISLNRIGSLGPLLAEANIPATGLSYRGHGGWRTYAEVRRTLRARPADALIMTGTHLLTSLALDASNASRRVLAVHFHHAGVKPVWQWKFIYRIACRRFHAVTFPSDFTRHEAENIYPPLAKIAHTLRNPIAIPAPVTTEQRLAARVRLGFPSDAKVVGNAGWLIPRKRFDIFLQVAQRVVKDMGAQDVCFVIAGGGSEQAALQELSRRLGIETKVKWVGWLEDMQAFYHAIDLLLFNSDWDAFPTTPLEAMAQGVPVVASLENGGLGEVIQSREHGILLGHHDVDRLATEVVAGLHASGTPQGLAGRDRVAELCNSEHLTGAMERLLS